MLKQTECEDAAQQIVDTGWAFLDCPTNCDPQQVLRLAPAFFDRRTEDWEQWQAKRPGEDETDVGVLMSNKTMLNHFGQPKDDKSHVMFSDDMAYLLNKQKSTNIQQNKQDGEFLALIEALHQASRTMSVMLLRAISSILELEMDLGTACEYAQNGCRPTATRTTRVMQYFKAGGKPHLDRCGLTSPHWGDLNGELFVVDRLGNERVVSPPKGKVLVFASLKLQIATGGLIPAVPHGSYCSASDRRLAAVTFEQLVTRPLIKDSEVAVARGLDKHCVVAKPAMV